MIEKRWLLFFIFKIIKKYILNNLIPFMEISPSNLQILDHKWKVNLTELLYANNGKA